MTITFLPASDRAATPWRNGGGVTREVAVAPDDTRSGAPADQTGAAAGTDFRWRVSIAEVDRDGPFSMFPGHRRIITVLRGTGMELTVDGVAHRVEGLHEPFVFSGDSRTDCRLLDGPIVDLNVIARADLPVGVDIWQVSGAVTIPLWATTVIVALHGTVTVTDGDAIRTLAPLDGLLARAEPPMRVHATGGSALAVIRLVD